MMKIKPSRIVIVQEGVLETEKYSSYANFLKHALESATVPAHGLDEEEKLAETIEIVFSWQEAQEKAIHQEVDIVFFISVNMVEIGRQMRKQFPNLSVYVLIGEPADGEPYIVPKSILNLSAIQSMAWGN